MSLQDVRAEHKKCNVKTSHLFVVITDKDFTEVKDLADNEIVLSYSDLDALMGKPLALLQKFNHHFNRQALVTLPSSSSLSSGKRKKKWTQTHPQKRGTSPLPSSSSSSPGLFTWCWCWRWCKGGKEDFFQEIKFLSSLTGIFLCVLLVLLFCIFACFGVLVCGGERCDCCCYVCFSIARVEQDFFKVVVHLFCVFSFPIDHALCVAVSTWSFVLCFKSLWVYSFLFYWHLSFHPIIVYGLWCCLFPVFLFSCLFPVSCVLFCFMFPVSCSCSFFYNIQGKFDWKSSLVCYQSV